jgi:hypothetical protein
MVLSCRAGQRWPLQLSGVTRTQDSLDNRELQNRCSTAELTRPAKKISDLVFRLGDFAPNLLPVRRRILSRRSRISIRNAATNCGAGAGRIFLCAFFLGRVHIGGALSAAAPPIAGNGTVADVCSGEVPIAPPIGLC